MMNRKMKKIRSNEAPLNVKAIDRLIHVRPRNAVAYAAALEVLG